MKECKHCKTLNPDDYIYCMNCGKKLPKDNAAEKGGNPAGFTLNKKFIPLIATALIYLITAHMLASGFAYLEYRLNPVTRRRRAKGEVSV